MTIPSVLMLTDTPHDPAARYSSAWLYDVDDVDVYDTIPYGDELRQINRQQILARQANALGQEQAA